MGTVEDFLVCREKFINAVLKFTNNRFTVERILLRRTSPQDDSSSSSSPGCKLYDLDSIIKKAKPASAYEYIETVIKQESVDIDADTPGHVSGGSVHTPGHVSGGSVEADDALTSAGHQKRKVQHSDGDGDSDVDNVEKKQKTINNSSTSTVTARNSVPSVDSLIATLETGNYASIMSCLGRELESGGSSSNLLPQLLSHSPPHIKQLQEEFDDDDYTEDSAEYDAPDQSTQFASMTSEYMRSLLPANLPHQNVYAYEYRCPLCEEGGLYEDWTPLLQHVCDAHFPGREMECQHTGCDKLFSLPPVDTLCKLKTQLIPTIMYHNLRLHGVPLPAFLKKFPCPLPGCDVVHVSNTLMRKHMARAHLNVQYRRNTGRRRSARGHTGQTQEEARAHGPDGWSGRGQTDEDESSMSSGGDDGIPSDGYAPEYGDNPESGDSDEDKTDAHHQPVWPRPLDGSEFFVPYIKEEPEDYDEYRADGVENASDYKEDPSYSLGRAPAHLASRSMLPSDGGGENMVVSEHRCPFCVDCHEDYGSWDPLIRHISEAHFPGGIMNCPHQGCQKIYTLPIPSSFSELRRQRIPSILYHLWRFHHVDFPSYFTKYTCPEPGCDVVHVSKCFLRKHTTSAHPAPGAKRRRKSSKPKKSITVVTRAPPVTKVTKQARQKKISQAAARKKISQPRKARERPTHRPKVEPTHRPKVEPTRRTKVVPTHRTKVERTDPYHNYMMFQEHRCMICNHDTVYDDWDQLGTHIREAHFDVIENDRYVMSCPEKCLRKFTIPAKDRKKPVQLLRSLLPSIVYHLYIKHNTPFPSYVTLFHCPDEECTYTHVTKSRLDQHREAHLTHNTDMAPRAVCDLCGKESRNKHFLTQHKAYYCKAVDRADAQRYQCPQCEKDYGSPDALLVHIKRSHMDLGGKYICQYCSKVVTTQYSLNQHIFRAHGQNPTDQPVVSCPHCPYQIISDKKLQAHINIVHKIQHYTCKICDEAFTKIGSYKRHMEIHSDKVYRCELCSYTSKHRHCYSKHMSAQHSERRFSCSYCSYSSGYRENTMKHMRSCAPKHAALPTQCPLPTSTGSPLNVL